MGTLWFPGLNEHSTGICSRVFRDVFHKTRAQNVQATFRVSFLELYNRRIHDLLSPDAGRQRKGERASLEIRESRKQFYVAGETKLDVKTPEDLEM